MTRCLGCLMYLLCVGCQSGREPSADPSQVAQVSHEVVQVAAASDLVEAFEELGELFEVETKRKVNFSFGSTGLIAKQIEQGAPFDVFAAADVSFVVRLVKTGVCDGATQARYARGRLAVWSREGGVTAPAALADLADIRFSRIAIASPEHAPYGKAAKEALEHAGLWPRVERRIVYGENVKQALQFASSGNAEVAIVALSLVAGRPNATYLLVDETLHAPLEQALVVCRGGKSRSGGLAFAAFVNSPKGRAVMRRFGFALPAEALGSTP